MTNLYNSIVPQNNIFKIDWGVYAILKLLSAHKFDTVLDIGSGAGEHKRLFQYFGKKVFSVDVVKNADYVGDFLEIDFDKKFDVIWCSHVLEHQRNVGIFLDKIFDVLKDDGVLAISVPMHHRERLVSGHLTSWSVPLLCYNLIMSGFDCKDASVISIFELSLIVRKKYAEHKELRKVSAHGADAGVEFEEISGFFPFPAKQGAEISGSGTINWETPTEYILPMPSEGKSTDIKIDSKNFINKPQLIPKIIFES